MAYRDPQAKAEYQRRFRAKKHAERYGPNAGPQTGRHKRRRPDTLDELIKRTIPVPFSGCWLWLGGLNANGYGVAPWRRGRGSTLAHVATYSKTIGPVPDGLEIDHLCRVRCCVNPDHLEAVTHKINSQRGECGKNTGKIMRSRTQCKRGHSLSGENLLITSNGGRRCRSCVRQQSQDRRRQRARNISKT